MILLCASLAACAESLAGEDLLQTKLEPQNASTSSPDRQKTYAARQGPAESSFSGAYLQGTDQFTGIGNTPRTPSEPGDLTLNLVNAPIPDAAKSILGDILQANYTIDGRVSGTVTVQTSAPVSRATLLAMFDEVLRDNGAAMIVSGKGYRIVPSAEAGKALLPLETGVAEPSRPGLRNHVVPLAYVSAEEMKTVLESIAPQGMVLDADERRNALILSGTDQEIATLRETISLFDVDWMRGMSFALIPVKASSPAAIVRDLDQVFETRSGPLKGIVRFVPNKRLKSVLVISSRAKYLRDASAWIRKLDVLAETSEARLHVYHVQNRTASEIAKVLQSVFTTREGKRASVEADVAPKLAAAQVTSQGQENSEPVSGPETVKGGYDDPATDIENGGEAASATVRIVADDSNNALLIVSNDAEYERISTALEDIDSVPNQVLLEAIIAEVSLGDDLRFGVRWFFGNGEHRGTFSDALSGAVASTFPGFSYFLKAGDISFTLNALSSVTNVKVLSSPSLVVLDNHTAVLQVGDQVPVVTQQATGVDTPGAPVVNSVELKDTGVILRVTPRVNDSGRVILEIEQEVSDVVKTTTSGIDSPTIRQRKVKTSVAVTDGEALALGGLIQEREAKGKTKVPVLGDLPLIRNAFREKTESVARTELIIFIRPRVIRDMEEARRVTQEFRKQLSIEAPRIRRGEAKPGDELVRILQ